MGKDATGWVKVKVPWSIKFFKASATSPERAILARGAVLTLLPSIVILPLFKNQQ